MAVIEELVARLGFETKGLGDLKKFDKALEGAKKNLDGFGKAANKTIGNPLNPMSKMGTQAAQNAKQMTGLQRVMQGVARVFTAFALGATRVAAALLRTTAIVGSLAMRFTGLAAGVAGITYALFRMASAAALAAAKTAKLRREAQLSAKGQGTTAGNLDKVAKGLALSGVKPDDWKSMVGSVAEKANDAILEGDLGKFNKAGISVLDAEGRQRDTSETALDIIARYADMRKAAIEARDKSKATKGKGAKAARDKANTAELSARRFASDFGIEGDLKGALDEMKGGAKELFAQIAEMVRRNPGPTEAQEERSKKIAADAARLQASLDALDKVGENLKDAITEKVLPPLVAFGDGLVGLAKKMGWISETAGERDERLEKQREANRGRAFNRVSSSSKIDAALNEAGKPGGDNGLVAWLMGDEVEKARAKLKSAAESYRLAQVNRDSSFSTRDHDATAKGFWDTQIAARGKELMDAFDGLKAATSAAASGSTDSMSQSAEKAASALDNAASGASRFSEAMKAWQAIASPTQGAKGLAEQTGDKIENDNRKYENIGNDQRTISPTVNINQTISGMEGAAAAAGAAAKSGVLGAVSSKGANTSTGAINAP